MIFAQSVRSILRRSICLSMIENRIRFPGLRMDPSVRHQIDGRFHYGEGCSIGQGSIVAIPAATTLRLGAGVYVGRNVELGPQAGIEIGDFTSIQDRCLLIGDVAVGRYCAFSLNVLITSGRHYYDLKPHWLIKDQDNHVLSTDGLSAGHSQRVRIEDDCWLGVNTVVSAGVTVGKGCVVGANSVVTKDLPPYSVAVGMPARVIKDRLRFEPPASVDSDVEYDLPYFYSGVRVSSTERSLSGKGDGLTCGKAFSLALSSPSSSAIVLLARSEVDDVCSVRLGDQVRELGTEFDTIRFAAGATNSWKFDFKVEGVDRDWPISIKRAWLE